MTTSCLACGAAVAPGSRFCRAGGKAQPVPPAALLSPRFATPVAYTPRHLADRILNSRSALQGERKRVTVVFCDIVDSSTLAARLGDERMHGLLQRFFEVALDEIHRYEGTINQFLGDGFMALFGAPLALEQHERQATLATVAIAERVKRDLAEAPELAGGRLALRMGINTGLVVVGKIGDNLRMDYTAVGDTTNVAAHLQAAAEHGGILMSDTTWERARDVVDSQPIVPIALKGKAEPVVAHRVIGIRADTSPAGTRQLTEFVGRGRELAELREALEHARHSRGQLVSIVGESGMGKSRLILEFRRTLADDVPYPDRACLSYGSAIPYLPILGLLRRAFGIVDGDTPDAMADKAARLMRELRIDPDDTVPYVLHLLGVKQGTARLDALSPEAIKSKPPEVLRQLVLRASHRRPLALVMEDVHWTDQASEDFLSELADVLPAAAVPLV